MTVFVRRALTTGCTIEIETSAENVYAHVALDGAPEINPGDRVRVHGAPIRVGFGERITLRRTATLERASLLERLWTKFAARFELAELYEVSFTPTPLRRLP